MGGLIWGIIGGILGGLKGMWEKIQLRNRIKKARERGGFWRRKYYKLQQEHRKEKTKSAIKDIEEKLNEAKDEDDFEKKSKDIEI